MKFSLNTQKYTCIFPLGLFGIFIIYLVSQHSGFHKHKIAGFETDKKYYKKHIQLDRANYLLPYGNDINDYVDIRVNATISKYNIQTPKFIFKLKPHGYDSFNPQVVPVDYNLIVLYTIHHEIYNKRHQLNLTNIEDLSYLNSEEQYRQFSANIDYLEENYRCIRIDPIEIIFFKNETEYIKLCNWIDSDPLSNWKEMCDDYIKLIDFNPLDVELTCFP